MERMARDVKNLRRKGNKDWKLVRKVFRCSLLKARYEDMSKRLGESRDPAIFKMVKQLEGRRAVPPITIPNGTTLIAHQDISDLIAEQLLPSDKVTMPEEYIDLEVSQDELKRGLKSSPTNTAGGIDGMSYPFLRFWYRKDKEGMMKMVNNLVKNDCANWHKAETILIKKGDKARYDVVKSWRMIHLLPVLAKVVERIILEKMSKVVEMEETQYGSRKNRSTHDMFKQIAEFVEWNKQKAVGILVMDVEGGFVRVDVDILCDVLVYRGCPEILIRWIRRWVMGRSIKLRFNGKISKEYHLNKGVPQGSPLSPFLFGVYVADVFRPKFLTRMGMMSYCASYVDDGALMAAANDIDSCKAELTERFKECRDIARGRGMGFDQTKVVWIGFGKESWGALDLGDCKKEGVGEIRILGYRMDKLRGMGGHVDYWMDRGVGVKRRIAGLGRRYGSEGGLGAWECVRLLKGVYLPTVYYGLEFVARDDKAMKRLEYGVRDTIRSTFRTPLKFANKILQAESGIIPTSIKGKTATSRAYARHVKFGYGKDLPWFGCLANDWKEDWITDYMTISDRPIGRVPDIIIDPNRTRAKEADSKRWDEGLPQDELWVYTDGSKSKGMGAIGWVKMGGEECVEEELGARVPESWSIVKMEICAIAMALRDMKRWNKDKIKVFTDSASALSMIRNMEQEGDSSPLWHMMAGVLKEWAEVTLIWVPGHEGVPGNEAADKVAKRYRNRKLNEHGRWRDMDYVVSSGEAIRERAREEWSIWHDKEGHDYYTREPKKPKHLRSMTRLDFYVLARLRSGADNRGHEKCMGGDNRFHLINCPRYDKSRPEPETIMNDRYLSDWCKWWKIHEFLGMGIPANVPEQMNTRVMFGNPFDGTITVEIDGKWCIKRLDKIPCLGCGKVHTGRCVKEMADLNGRWFFVGKDTLECRVCGASFGGGSTTRPGGSGLKAHISRNKLTCGRKWEVEYWEDVVRNWDNWGDDFKLAIVVKWAGKDVKGTLECEGCQVRMGKIALAKHMRMFDDCCSAWESRMRANLWG